MLTPSDVYSVRGRTALVTGGATGLGRVCAEALLAAGARVLIASRKAEACEAAAAELSAMAEAIRAADGIIFVTPEYNHSIPGVLKNAIDWLSRLPNQPCAGKPVAIQSASPSLFGGLRAHLHLRHVFVYLDARPLNKPEVIIPQAQTKIDAATGEITDAATRGFLADQLKAFAAFVRG